MRMQFLNEMGNEMRTGIVMFVLFLLASFHVSDERTVTHHGSRDSTTRNVMRCDDMGGMWNYYQQMCDSVDR